jgi:hypothetical protein
MMVRRIFNDYYVAVTLLITRLQGILPTKIYIVQHSVHDYTVEIVEGLSLISKQNMVNWYRTCITDI